MIFYISDEQAVEVSTKLDEDVIKFKLIKTEIEAIKQYLNL